MAQVQDKDKGVALKVYKILRALLPRRVVSAVRLISIFQYEHAHVKRIDGFTVDRYARPRPWLTYPLIEFPERLDFSDKRVFEFGAGSSTLYWAERAASVTSVEMDRQWYESVRRRVPENVRLIYEPDGGVYPTRIRSLGGFDAIVIDGAERYRSAMAAREALNPGGFIILDNAEWYPNASDYLASSGLIEVPFCGFSPLNAFTSISTMFISPDFSFRFNERGRRPPVGGCRLPTDALDDKPVAE